MFIMHIVFIRTWFPYAIICDDEYDQVMDVHEPDDIPDLTMDNIAIDKSQGKDGLLVVGREYEGIIDDKHIIRVNQGDAIAFYRYY